MARLTATERAKLPDSAFAYVDSRGRRRLPINDEAHVRNALARFDQVAFEDDAARERARTRLLKAAKKYGIVPVGFISGQFESARKHATAGRLVIDLHRIGVSHELEDHLRRVLWDPGLRLLHWSEKEDSYLDTAGRPVALPTAGDEVVTYLERDERPLAALVHSSELLDDPDLAEAVLAAVRFIIERAQLAERTAPTPPLPAGFITMLMTDIQGSTGLLARLGDRYEQLLSDVRGEVRERVRRAGGREVEARADEYFAVFEKAGPALRAALDFQQAIASRPWPDGLEVRVRAAIHSGDALLTDEGYIGLSVHTASRLCAAGHGGQILISGESKEAVEAGADGISFRNLGLHRLRGLPEAQEVFQVEAEGLERHFPPLRGSVASPSEP